MGILVQRPRRSGDIPTSPMADIAFLLLIFFLVTTVFDEERGLSLVMPQTDDIVQVSPDNVLHLGIQADGTVDVRRGNSPRVQRSRPAEVGGIWRTEVVDHPGLIAAVRTAADAPYGAMIDVLDALQTAGAERVHLGLLAGADRVP